MYGYYYYNCFYDDAYLVCMYGVADLKCCFMCYGWNLVDTMFVIVIMQMSWLWFEYVMCVGKYAMMIVWSLSCGMHTKFCCEL